MLNRLGSYIRGRGGGLRRLSPDLGSLLHLAPSCTLTIVKLASTSFVLFPTLMAATALPNLGNLPQDYYVVVFGGFGASESISDVRGYLS